jgi:hypothetical protein
MKMDKIEKIKTYLREYRSRAEDQPAADTEVRAEIEFVRAEAVTAQDEGMATTSWCLKQICDIQATFISAFSQLQAERFYDSWCSLEQVEIGVSFLERHMHFDRDEYGIKFIWQHAGQFQRLFPYRVFMSPAWIETERRCSICGSALSIRTGCAHRIGDIYDGQMCCHIITAGELLEVSVVDSPVQKYSVPFATNAETGEQIDRHDYSLLQYVCSALRNPFDAWSMEWTKMRHPHAHFKGVDRNSPCPCESGRKYKSCCLKESGVLRPHLQIMLAVPPPASVPTLRYPRRRPRSEGESGTPGDQEIWRTTLYRGSS